MKELFNKISADGFVKIRSVFDPKKRDVSSLATLYNDHTLLKNYLKKLTSEEVNLEKIQGRKIFLKPNWVKHSSNETDHLCLRTHESFILAFLEIVIELMPQSIVIGDAPIQGCKWDKMLDADFTNEVLKLSLKHQIKVEIKDLRRKVMDLASKDMVSNVSSLDDFIIFDVGEASYLEPVTDKGKNKFRVTHYNPDRFKESHASGMHKYCITKELFEADIVISLPKIKTHEKSGITNALKNIVGLNGDKDFLPHHKIGGTKSGGDSYPGNHILRNWSELCYDNANRNLGKKSYWFWVRLASFLWKLSNPGPMDRFGAGWHGNDTTWRMVMDLNLIAIYGKSDGTISKNPQRLLYSLCDGIVGGQKDGPLSPDPLALGVICFTNDSSWADICMATLMGMDIRKLPLLTAARDFSSDRHTSISYNDKSICLDDLKNHIIEAQMPSGWIHYKNA